MPPFEIKARFKPDVAKQGGLSGISAHGLEALGEHLFFPQVIVGITENWDTDDNISGAKLHIRTRPVGRNFALAKRVVALLQCRRL